ncbi:MAG: glycogen/starch/alpha-glucan phosphorylase [Calditrichia bacterium]
MKQKKTDGLVPRIKISPAARKLSPSTNELQGTDVRSLQNSFVNHLEFSLAKDQYSATQLDFYKSLALTVRDRLIERWIETQQTYYKKGAKRIYYFSMEFLMGRILGDALINLGLYENVAKALQELGLDLEELQTVEPDAALGNGGLGRLAACYLESMATLELPAYGYGIRYEYGIFNQKIENGYQKEMPENWLRFGNPWEIERPEYCYPVKFYGRVNQNTTEDGRVKYEWVDTRDVIAMAYDTPIPGYGNNTVNNLRLWAAKSTEEFNLEYFNTGDYERAVAEKVESETISKVLYPNDNFLLGRELRLKQEYFLVSASLQDIIRRFKKIHSNRFENFPRKVAVQLNDTHPALAIPELMRLLIDIEGLNWEKAWEVTQNTFGYTNHTILPEALEKWRVSIMETLLPRHMQLIYEINHRFLNTVSRHFPGNLERLRDMSIIEEGDSKRVRMSHLAIVGSRSVNGVAKLHSEILKNRVFKNFYDLWPEKFNNKTNGITQRRWLLLSNPDLASLISEKIGKKWITDLYELKKLIPFAEDSDFQVRWQAVKRKNKERLAAYIDKELGVSVDLHSIFDCQVKRIHEYKRQFLNVLHVITLYNRIKADPQAEVVPRTVIFAGKAAPGYFIAKLIIKLIHCVANAVNTDPEVQNRLKVVFLPNYSVSLAQLIIPAADLSEQISTAGMEASGTGNMKLALNGALTIGTLDGANIEILEEVGEENIFIFGLTADAITEMRQAGYNPWEIHLQQPELKRAIEMIQTGYFSKSNPELFKPLINALWDNIDYYMIVADFPEYLKCQERVSQTYKDQKLWTKMSILNVAHMGKFSSDRSIREYAEEIWRVKPIPIQIAVPLNARAGKNKTSNQQGK